MNGRVFFVPASSDAPWMMSSLHLSSANGIRLSHRSVIIFATPPSSEIPASLTLTKGECKMTPPTFSPSTRQGPTVHSLMTPPR